MCSTRFVKGYVCFTKLKGCPKFLVRIHLKKDLMVISREEGNIVTGDYLEIFITLFPTLNP